MPPAVEVRRRAWVLARALRVAAGIIALEREEEMTMKHDRIPHANLEPVRRDGSTTTIAGTREQLEAIREAIRRGLAGAPTDIESQGWDGSERIAVKVVGDPRRT
jgi:hypothetical protein